MMDISMIYLGVVILILAIGFVFALRIGIIAALEADRAWPAEARAVVGPSSSQATAATESVPAHVVAVAEQGV